MGGDDFGEEGEEGIGGLELEEVKGKALFCRDRGETGVLSGGMVRG